MNVHVFGRASRAPTVAAAAALAVAAGLFGAPAALASVPCAVAPDAFEDEPPPLRTRAALAAGGTVTIVAIGGASTGGEAAGGTDKAWPAQLGAALEVLFPTATITVVNEARPRQTAAEMAARFAAEVAPARPQLVVWEAGITDAVRGEDIDQFRQALAAGIGRLRRAGIEVVLMDMQFSRRAAAIINLDRYLNAVRDIADAYDIARFRRYDFMRDWAESGALNYEPRNQAERAATAARLYGCIGQALARLIAEAGTPPAPPALLPASHAR